VKALLVCAAPVSGNEDLVAGLADGADIVIAVDGGGSLCLESGVTPDLLVGDFDSLDSSLVDELVSRGVTVRTYPADKNATDLELAIGEARALGATEITVTAATTGRLDHTLGVLASLAAACDLMPTIVERDLSAWLVCDCARQTVTLGGMKALVSLIAFGGPARITARGLRWPLENADITPATTLGISNVVTGAAGATLTVHVGCVFALSVRDERPPAVRLH
jgi:thiamine pyrophosphokinase